MLINQSYFNYIYWFLDLVAFMVALLIVCERVVKRDIFPIFPIFPLSLLVIAGFSITYAIEYDSKHAKYLKARQ